ncbi:MAG: DUF5916 domain-containing protein [Flavobacteriaceae bacterium]
MKHLLLVLLCFSFGISSAQEDKKSLQINRTSNAPKIDGVLDDSVWDKAQPAEDFIQFKPEMGKRETNQNKSIVKLTYDDNAIYVGAYLYDDPNLIMRQFNSRDNFGQSDFFGVVFNPNNDAQNDTEFFVFSSGAQADAIANPSIGEDFSWNAVWDSAIKIVADGWIVEMRIPYSALRFSNSDGPQTWGINFHRHFRRTQEQFTWNPIDTSKGNIGLYHGELNGLENISPPTRLSFYPFISGTETRFDGTKDSNFGAGLDVKYGVSENFTLDATLIPDFSQTGVDDVTLNLGPFEQTFSEQRQFFTEGVDLFNKGNLFYSRRIGNTPTAYFNEDNLESDEIVVENPDEVNMLNAIKLSGRTKNGLGIGVFNAITEKTEAKIRNTSTGKTRFVTTEPFTNYNVLVLDQQFNKNSSVSLVNTNVTRNGHFRDANVTAALVNLSNKANTYNISGHLKMSNINYGDDIETGFNSNLSIGKISGNYQFRITHNLADKTYDINDFGISQQNNYNNFLLDASYRTFKPTKNLNRYNINTWFNYRQLYKPNTYTGNNFGADFYAKTKTLHDFGGRVNFEAGKQYDYFEPRTEGRYFVYENSFDTNFWISSNYNNTLAIDANIGCNTLFEQGRDYFDYWYAFTPIVRINSKFKVSYTYEFSEEAKDRGYVTTYSNDDILFGQRDQKTTINSLSGNYNFNTNHGLTLTLRNYWTTVNYDNQLYTLENNGRLSSNNNYTVDQTLINDADYSNPNINYDIWNFDLKYSWQFAPGSQLTALYRNQLFNRTNDSDLGYIDSLNHLFKAPLKQIFSLKIIYYLDYNNLKKALKKSTT